MSHCPECGANMDLDADELQEGAIISCPECSSELEVVNTHPLELDVIGDEEDDDAEDEDSDEESADEDEDDSEDEEDNGFH